MLSFLKYSVSQESTSIAISGVQNGLMSALKDWVHANKPVRKNFFQIPCQKLYFSDLWNMCRISSPFQ
jgi:hypothetical protein